MKKLIIAVVVVLVAVLLWFGFIKNKNSAVDNTPQTPAPLQAEPKITYSNATTNMIVVSTPFPGSVTGKDFSIIGQARGTWFFEASFPVELLDKDGKVIASGHAQAQGDWMTENFVPFRADIKAPDTYIGPATLVLKKDNPSDLLEHDASVSFPITVEY